MFIKDLESLHSGELKGESFREKYLDRRSDKDHSALPDIAGNLSHFLDDEDLRRNDPEYKKMQESELEKLIKRLKQGAPESELKRITFLGYSK